ncbi:ion transporter [Variovorax sp. N23]|uniref:ion transporter n=1 Tax=Variovorax sp. N23 TaxID=2980555 RepID=UPI0021C9BDA2|nr:ion transporter [Variovorax sp. N23]MCU4120342.1 ion transporter [Variovorax sp. N23]
MPKKSSPRSAVAGPVIADEVPVEIRFGKPEHGWRLKLYAVIFESETRAGRWFDLALIAVILVSVGVVVLDSVQPIRARWGAVFGVFEWFFTIVFTLEYIARLACVKRPIRYAMSFYGVVDLLALLPTYLAILMPELSVLIDVRILRLLRVFRIFKMSRYAAEYRTLVAALAASRRKIMVFVGFVLMVVLVLGTLMYVVEGPQHGFTSIPVAVYWAISTMTTVGFGDLVPKTDIGRAIASVMMLLGWGVLAVPTGIVSAEMVRYGRDAAPALTGGHGLLADALHVAPDTRSCTDCGTGQHTADARFCRCCGRALD